MFSSYDDAAKNLRRYLSDTPQLNTLDQEFETTDDELVDYIKDTMNDLNINFEPKTFYTLNDVVVEPGEDGFISWGTVRCGAVLQYLIAKGILNARNMLTYSDAGGVTVTDRDRWGRYINFYNVLVNKYLAGVRATKLRVNISNAMGGSASPLSFDIY